MMLLSACQSSVVVVASMLCFSMGSDEWITKNVLPTPVSERFLNHKLNEMEGKFEAWMVALEQKLDTKLEAISLKIETIIPNIDSAFHSQAENVKTIKNTINEKVEEINESLINYTDSSNKKCVQTINKYDLLSTNIDLLAENNKKSFEIIQVSSKNNSLCCTMAETIVNETLNKISSLTNKTSELEIRITNKIDKVGNSSSNNIKSIEVEAYCNKYNSALFASLFSREKRGICLEYKSKTISAADENACGKLCIDMGNSCIGFCYSDTDACQLYSVPSPSGTVVINGIGYFYPNVQESYQGAVDYCDDIGLYLALPMNVAEEVALRSVAGANTYYWIGAHDRDVEGAYECEYNGAKLSYYNWDWSDGQPDNEGRWDNEDCLMIWGGGWNDLGCRAISTYQIPTKFVCQTTPPCACHNAPTGNGEATGYSCYMRKPSS